MERITHSLVQGSPEWHQFRSTHYGASEAAAMLGLSKYTTRAELLRAKAIGAEKEIGASLQAVFDKGHATEAAARPLAEAVIGKLLYPVTCSYGKLSASCDGLEMDEDMNPGEIAFEHKQYSADLFAAVMRNELPEEHQPQCQQVMLVTGATKLFFVCSDGTRDHFAGMWIHADLAWMARIEAGWLQFAADLAAYVPVEAVVVPVAAPIRDLPAIRYQLNGLSLTSNLSEFKEAALVLVEDSKKELTTDQDFADTDARNKAFKEAESKIDLMCAQVVGEIEDVDKFTRDLKAVSDLIRQARLNGERKVAARKDAIRVEIVAKGRCALDDHISGLNKRIGKPYMTSVNADFAGAAKGKRTIASLHDAVDTELARAKIAANEIADRIQINLTALNAVSGEYPQLFPDAAAIVTKPLEDFNHLVNARVALYKDNEAKRIEAAKLAADLKRVQDETYAADLAAKRLAEAKAPVVPMTPADVLGAAAITTTMAPQSEARAATTASQRATTAPLTDAERVSILANALVRLAYNYPPGHSEYVMIESALRQAGIDLAIAA